MSITLTKQLNGTDGNVYVDPNAVMFVTGETSICHLHLIHDIIIHVRGSAEQTAETLWGYTNKIDNGFYNMARAVAVTATDAKSCRMHFSASDFADINMPVDQFMETTRFADAYRAELDRKKETAVTSKSPLA